MRQFLYVAVLLATSTFGANAASCINGSLASYVALGAAGCSIGQNTYFNFQSLRGAGGNTEINPTAVTIMPSGGSPNPELTISVDVTAMPPFGGVETMFNYSVTGGIYTREVLTLSNASEPVDGGVTDTVNYCENGPFGPNGVTGCAGITGGTNLVAGVINQDSFTFGPPSFISLTDDLVITAGATQPASGATITDQLTSVPEPDSYLLSAVGFVFALVFRSRLPRRG